MKDKEKQEISIIGRLLSMEVALVVIGVFFIISGFRTGAAIQFFWGGIILFLMVILFFVRRRDWKAHWEEQARMAEAMRESQRRKKEDPDARK